MRLKITVSLIIIQLFWPLLIHSNTINQQSDESIVNGNENEHKLYEVTEIINMPFGSSKITYNVSDKSLINKNDLGPNNIRIIKEKIIHPKKNATDSSNIKATTITKKVDSNNTINNQMSIKTITIDPLETYERMVEKGLTSIEILKKLGDSYFYKNDYVKASKYYEALFKMTNNLSAEYYFRYSNVLNNMGQKGLLEELLEKYKTLTLNDKNYKLKE